MLPKKNRITRKDFPANNRQGFRVFSQFFTIVVYKEIKETKISVVVSKKISKSAVVRNKTRRVFYEAVKVCLDEFNKICVIVIYPKKESLSADFKEIVEELKKTLKKTGVLIE